jgi:predicted RNA-binding protein with TRAM domain
MMGGYQAKQTAPLGTMGEPLWVRVMGGTGFGNMSVSSNTGNLTSGTEKTGNVFVDGVAANNGLAALKTPLGSNPMQPMWIKDANNPAGALGLPAAGGAGIQFPNGHSYAYDADGYITPSGGSGDGTGIVPGAVGGPGGGSPAAAAGATVANSFKTNMASVIPMIGMMFAAKFKSPIAQIGAMFLSMMLSKMMTAQAGGGGGGGGGGILGSILSIFGGGGGVPGGLEGGLTSGGPNGLVNRYNVSPAAFVNAPHYAEGTGNTSGGMPAILHENEAVIPLSRGRKVPVELTGVSSRGNGTTVINNFNVSSPDADSFRKSKQQIASDLHAGATRAYARNNP